jgi:hypothetical protein
VCRKSFLGVVNKTLSDMEIEIHEMFTPINNEISFVLLSPNMLLFATVV